MRCARQQVVATASRKGRRVW